MSTAIKVGIAAALAAWGSDYVVRTFTSAADSDNEKLMWGVGSAFAIGMVAAKMLKVG